MTRSVAHEQPADRSSTVCVEASAWDSVFGLAERPTQYLYRQMMTRSVGKLADLAVLVSDPRKVEPTAISDIKISQTWMDGTQVFGS